MTAAPAAVSDASVTVPERALFIHVMKTGGSTLIWHLRENLAADEVYPRPGIDLAEDGTKPMTFRHHRLDYLGALPEERRRLIRVYAGHFPYVAREIIGGELITMTILRDPVARTISLLRQWCRNRPQLALSLEGAYELPQVYGPLIHNHQTKVFSITADDGPAGSLRLMDMDDSRLELAKESLDQVDIVGLTERYDGFLDLVTERFGWRVKRGVRANVAPVEDLLTASPSLRHRIAEDNALDMDLYAHARELVEARERRRSMHT